MRARVMAGHNVQLPLLIEKNRLVRMLNALNRGSAGFLPEISSVDIAGFDTTQLAAMIISKNIWLMVSGSAVAMKDKREQVRLDLQSVLNKVRCPLLIVPENWALKQIERITYIADLRYCRAAIVNYLVQLAQPMQASISLAHLSAKGLPDIEEGYGRRLFTEQIAGHVHGAQVGFNNIREKDIKYRGRCHH
jgi:hypothetical protein